MKPLRAKIDPGAALRGCPNGGLYSSGCMQGFQQPGAPPINPYSASSPGMPAGPPGPGGQLSGSYMQMPYGQPLQQPAAPAIPGVQSTSLYLGFEAAPDFNVAQRLKGPSECDQLMSAAHPLEFQEYTIASAMSP